MPEKFISSHEAEILDRIGAIIDGHKREFIYHYAELKLGLPATLRSVTIGQVREAGGTVDPDITISITTQELLKKDVAIREKIAQVLAQFEAQVQEYYGVCKKQLPGDAFQKKMGEPGVEKNQLGLCLNGGENVAVVD